MDKQLTLLGIFPTPILKSTFNRPFTDEEILYFENVKLRPNNGNWISVDDDILNNPLLVDLSLCVQQLIDNYLEAILNPANDSVQLYLTQSWINVSYPGQEHHGHVHPNSIVSGIVYLCADGKIDQVSFEKPATNQIRVKPENFNEYNAETWSLKVGTSDIVLFPSTLKHSVNRVQESQYRDKRVSLSFNTFIKGDFGNAVDRTGLKL